MRIDEILDEPVPSNYDCSELNWKLRVSLKIHDSKDEKPAERISKAIQKQEHGVVKIYASPLLFVSMYADNPEYVRAKIARNTEVVGIPWTQKAKKWLSNVAFDIVDSIVQPEPSPKVMGGVIIFATDRATAESAMHRYKQLLNSKYKYVEMEVTDSKDITELNKMYFMTDYNMPKDDE